MSRPRVVLILSPDGLTRRTSESGLTVCGFDVLTASDGAEAVMLFDHYRRIDVLVTDAEMAGEIDGLSVARIARERNPKVEIIYTAQIPHRLPRSRLIEGAPCLRSPYAVQQIAAVISNLVGGRRASAEAA
jgi:CheY-like chemotaxis protein